MEVIPRGYHLFKAVNINVTTEPRLCDTHDVVVMNRDVVSNGKRFILHLSSVQVAHIDVVAFIYRCNNVTIDLHCNEVLCAHLRSHSKRWRGRGLIAIAIGLCFDLPALQPL